MSQPVPLYLDWQFWAALAAVAALILSQLPPVRLWLRPRRLEVEVHSRIQITHKAGNPNVGLFASVRNTGGRDLRVRDMQVSIARDGNESRLFGARNYYEQLSDEKMVLFVPFTLKPGDSWEHGTNFFGEFDRATEKFYREHVSNLTADIRSRLEARPDSEKSPIAAPPELVQPLLDLFERLFVWVPGEYVVELKVIAEPGSASFAQKYRFTLFESDSAELRSYTDDYKFGGGLAYNADRHVGIFVPLQPQSG